MRTGFPFHPGDDLPGTSMKRIVHEFLAHGFDAAAHFVEFGNPLCFQIRVFQHEGDGVRAVGGGVGIADQQIKAGKKANAVSVNTTV